MMIYRILAALLEYPGQDLVDNLGEILQALDDSLDVSVDERETVRAFIADWMLEDMTERQAAYVQTFDMTPEHSLHLTHHLFGDDKNRGPALIDLSEYYKGYGVEVAGNELPDYLPLMLEFAGSQLDETGAQVFLSDAVKVLGVLGSNLEKAGSPYAPLVRLVENRGRLSCLTA
ncbi:MAG: nitrate reductase molybdenum cofactor assembly chaperone [Burkholderiales bacterium]